MIGNFIIRQGSTQPWLQVQITQDGLVEMNLEAPKVKGCADDDCGDKSNVVDLTNAQVAFELRKCGRTPAQVALAGRTVVVDAECGIVRYEWALSDFPLPCLYYGTFVVRMPDATILRWPFAPEQLTIEVFP